MLEIRAGPTRVEMEEIYTPICTTKSKQKEKYTLKSALKFLELFFLQKYYLIFTLMQIKKKYIYRTHIM